MASLFNVPAVMVLIAIAIVIAADIRQLKIYHVLILPWVMVGLIFYFTTGGDVALLTALQGAAVPILMVAVISVFVLIQVVHSLGRRH